MLLVVPVGAMEGLWAVSGVGGSAGALCGLAAFAVLRGLLVVPVGGMGPFWPVDGSLRAVGRGGLWAVSKVESLVRSASSSEVYPAGKLQ